EVECVLLLHFLLASENHQYPTFRQTALDTYLLGCCRSQARQAEKPAGKNYCHDQTGFHP
ncbi:MAG: hypothetical protein KAW01_05530, partial [Deltaproteobacteria bacterium]|nr:hypothetical protein [Deltaproteobacteria bacterium]